MLFLALKAVFGLAVVTIAAFGAGAWIALWLPAEWKKWERLAFVVLGGFGLFSTVLFLVGQVSFTRPAILVVLGCGIVLAVALFHKVSPLVVPKFSIRTVPKLPAMVVILVLAGLAVGGLAEITGDWNYDEVAYHLLGPKVWLRAGVIRPVLDNCHTAFPQIAETLFAALLGVGGDRAPSFFGFVGLGLLLAVSASLARRCGASDSGAWWVAAIIASMPAVCAGARHCFVDALFAAFVIAAVRIGLDATSLREWGLLGIFGGFAIGTKYTGLIAYAVVLSCVVILNFLRSESMTKLSARIATALGAACIVGSAYYLRNMVLLGCPIYPPPPGYELLCKPKYLSAEAISQFHAYIRHRGFGLGRGIVAFLKIPFNLTYHTSNFHGAGGIGISLFALGPIGVWTSRKNPMVRVVLLMAALLTITWYVTQQESRFLIDVYSIGAIFAVLGWKTAQSWGKRYLTCLAATAVLISVGYGLLMIARPDGKDIRAVFSASYAAAKRRAEIPYLESFAFLNRENSVQRVLILDRSVTPYYLDKEYVKPVGQWGEQTVSGASDSAEALHMALAHRLEVSHVLDVNSEVSKFQVKPDTDGLTLVFEAADQRVYAISLAQSEKR